jgi:hypothetical protein
MIQNNYICSIMRLNPDNLVICLFVSILSYQHICCFADTVSFLFLLGNMYHDGDIALTYSFARRFLKNVDKFNNLIVSALCTAGRTFVLYNISYIPVTFTSPITSRVISEVITVKLLRETTRSYIFICRIVFYA